MAVMPVEEKKLIQATPGVFEIEGDQAYLIGTKCSQCGAFFSHHDMFVRIALPTKE